MVPLCSKSAFVQTNDWPLAGRGFNGQDVKPERGIAGAVFAKELPGHSRKMLLFLASDGFFGGAKRAVRCCSRFHLDKRDRRAVVSNQIDFAFHPAIGEVSRDHDVSVPAEIPVRVRLSANAGSARPLLGCIARGADESDRPFRAAQSTKPKIARAKIGTANPFFLCELCALCVRAFARIDEKL